MRQSLSILAALAALLAPMTWHAPSALAATPLVPARADLRARVIVKYRSAGALMRAQSAAASGDKGPQHAAVLSRHIGVPLTDGHAIGRDAQVVFASGMTSAELAAKLSADSEVQFAEPDRRRRILGVPNDPLYPGSQTAATPTVGQWYLRPPSTSTVSAINAENAWNITAGTSSVVVAVLDTGVRFDHPDLAGKVLPGFDFITDVATANDGNGRDADASDPGDWISQEDKDTDPGFADCAIEDSSWHGTQVAGLVGAATNNGVGMASVGRNVMVLPVRVLGKCGGFDSDITAAMLWAAGISSTPLANSHPAKIINMSLGSPPDPASPGCPQIYSSVVTQLTAANVTVVASAGNDEGKAVAVPANCPGVIAVAGVRNIGTKVGFSDVGPEVTISAPGGNCINVGATEPCLFPILTTSNNGTTAPAGSIFTDSFNISVGTSFSAPLVAGTVALMRSVQPSLTPAQIITALKSSARPFPTTGAAAGIVACQAPGTAVQDECYCTTSTCGAGLLDAAAAVAAVVPAQVPHVPVSASAASGDIGATVALDGSQATAAAGRSLTYAWTVSDPAIASFSSATNAPTATLLLNAGGTVTASLTVTDSAGAITTASTSVTVNAPPPPPPAPPADSGGGGAVGGAWLLLLALSIPGVAAARRRS